MEGFPFTESNVHIALLRRVHDHMQQKSAVAAVPRGEAQLIVARAGDLLPFIGQRKVDVADRHAGLARQRVHLHVTRSRG